MEKELYKMFEIDEQKRAGVGRPEDLDLAIAEKFKEKMGELYNKIKKILQEREITDFEKISQIDTKVQEMFAYVFAYMKIMSQQARKAYDSGSMQSLEEDMKNRQDILKKSYKIDHRKMREDTPIKCNAYQILGIPDERITCLTDRKIEEKTIKQLIVLFRKKMPSKTEEITDMIVLMQGQLWAYSKLSTTQNRKDYGEIHSHQKLVQEAKKCEAISIGKVDFNEDKNPVTVSLRPTVQSEVITITQDGRLVNNLINRVDGGINQYTLKRNINGKQTSDIFYSNIDLGRLQSDIRYAEFVRSRILLENTILLAKKYLGGYIGEIGSKMVEVNGQIEEKLVFGHSPKHIAICKRFQKDERDKIDNKRRKSNIEPVVQPQGGDPR